MLTAEIDFSSFVGVVARRLLGEPNKRLSNRRTLRFGSQGRLAVELIGTKRGTWYDHSAGVGGGVLDLVVFERGGDRQDAFNWLQGQRLIDVDEGSNRELPKPSPLPEQEPPQHAKLADWASRLWENCSTIRAGDPAGRYLLARGCTLPHPDGDLKWHPGLRHPCGHIGIGLVGLVTDVHDPGRWLNLHRTWITPDGSGRKADLARPRLLLKDHRKSGGCIRLWPDPEVDTRLTLGEGVETVLAAARTHRPAWSMLDAGNLKSLALLPGIEALTIVCDHDPAGIVAARDLGARWHSAGREVQVLYPSEDGKDWADVIANEVAR